MSSRQIASFLHQLGTMLDSGLSVVRSLQSLSASFPGALRKVAGQMARSIERGTTLHEAMLTHAGRFSPIELALVRAGEESGRLDRMLLELAERREELVQLRKRMMTRLAYPLILLHVGIAAGVLLAVVGPGGSQAAGVRYLLKVVLVYALCIGVYLAVRQRRRIPAFGRALDAFFYALPFIGGMLRRSCLVRFYRAFEATYAAGLSHARSLSLASEACGNLVVERRLKRAVPLVSSGSDLGEALQKTGVFEPMVASRLATGVQSGRLEETLIAVRKEAEFNAHTTADRLSVILPTLIYIGICVWVAVFVILKFWLGYFAQYDELLR